jgi:hypothetical protein
MEKILVSVAAYDENHLAQTLESCLEKASNPERIFFSVVEQRSDNKFSDLDKFTNLKIQRVYSPRPRGVGIARNESAAMLEDEDYVLVIDAHMVFNKDWDANLVSRIKELESKHGNQVLLSQHLPSAIIKNGKLLPHPERRFDAPSTLYFEGIHVQGEAMPRGKKYHRQYALTCHYIFARSDLFRDISFDPRIFYLAEEPVLAMRICTRGYKIFCSDYVPMFHLQKNRVAENRKWNNDREVSLLEEDAILIYETMSGKYKGYWGSPDQNSLEDFLINSKLNISYFMNGIDENDEMRSGIRQKIREIFFNDRHFEENLINGLIPTISNNRFKI